jgi:hypothetical protein
MTVNLRALSPEGTAAKALTYASALLCLFVIFLMFGQEVVDPLLPVLYGYWILSAILLMQLASIYISKTITWASLLFFAFFLPMAYVVWEIRQIKC